MKKVLSVLVIMILLCVIIPVQGKCGGGTERWYRLFLQMQWVSGIYMPVGYIF